MIGLEFNHLTLKLADVIDFTDAAGVPAFAGMTGR
jgi:hypothetical protein